MRSNLETFIQQWLASAGLTLHGQGISIRISPSLKDHTTGTIHIDLCAKSSDTEATMEDNQRPSPDKPSSQRPLSETFSPNTSLHSQRTLDGILGLTASYDQSGTLPRLLAENGGSLDVGTIQLPSGKLLH